MPMKDGVQPPPPPPPPPQKGIISVVFNTAGTFQAVNTLAFKDPAFKFDDFGDKRCKVYAVQFNVGDEYQIDMVQLGKGGRMDPYLYLKDDTGAVVTQDDDSGGDLNARIIFRPTRSGVYRIYATSFRATDTGAYTLSVRRIRTFPVDKGDPFNK